MTPQEKQQLKARFLGMNVGGKILVNGVVATLSGFRPANQNGEGLRIYFDDGSGVQSTTQDCKLILRPLSSITDAEAIEMFLFAGIFGIDVIRDADKIGVIGRGGSCAVIWIKISPKPIGCFLEAWNNVSNKAQPEVFEYMIADWLRSKHFALPFHGLDPVSEGWAILQPQTAINEPTK